jgi:hypothetical protein
MSRQRKLFLEKVNEFHEKGKLPDEVLKEFYSKLPVLERAVTAVEDASKLSYPTIVFDPSLSIIKYPNSTFSRTVIYASTRIQKLNGSYQLYVEISLPFLLYAKEGALKACVAHEFLHYIFNTIALNIKAFATLSGERLDSREVHIAYDDTHIVEPEDWLNDRELVDLIKSKFNPVILDEQLERDLKAKWMDQNLPVREIPVEESRQAIPILEITKIPLDENIIRMNKTKRFFLYVGR